MPIEVTTIYTIDQYNLLKAAIASGESRVKYQDKEVQYRSLSEMKEVLRDMANELGLITAVPSRRTGVFFKGV